ncbi:DNA repair enzyme [Ectocarpus siliculosus]|uniref:DNA repair enzyme n=1 Tax=Ectocarpus siliculosus TaxID=2880 RepID=D7FZY4_ECTSI|nr:DNA repair enzyme [Ectocarpus siliculosus]|eukprot:CBJ48609.1 DNA repair enzyme [Ectocarpus siliculosus]
MGIKNLWQLLSPVGRSVSIETLAGKTLAVDVSIWLTQFIKAMRDDDGKVVKNAHIIGTLRRVVKLLFHRIRPVFVFDGGAPALKARTLAARRKLRSEGTDSSVRKTAQRILASQLKKHKAAISAAKRASSQAAVPAFNPVYQGGDMSSAPATAPATTAGTGSGGTATSRATRGGKKQGEEGGVVQPLVSPEEAAGAAGDSDDDDDDDDVDWVDQEVEQGGEGGDGLGVLGAGRHAVVDSDGDEVYEGTNRPGEERGGGAAGVVGGGRSGAAGDVEAAAWAVDTDEEEEEEGGVAWEEVELPERNEDIDPEVIASLPDHVKKQVIEAAKRRQRMRSRAQYMPVAGNPAMYSQTQLSNFLRSNKLNAQILKAQKQDDSDRTGKRIASEAGRRYIMTPAGASGRSGAVSGAGGAAGGTRNGASSVGSSRRRRITDDGDDFKAWSYAGSAGAEGNGGGGVTARPTSLPTNADTDDDDDEEEEAGGFLPESEDAPVARTTDGGTGAPRDEEPSGQPPSGGSVSEEEGGGFLPPPSEEEDSSGPEVPAVDGGKGRTRRRVQLPVHRPKPIGHDLASGGKGKRRRLQRLADADEGKEDEEEDEEEEEEEEQEEDVERPAARRAQPGPDSGAADAIARVLQEEEDRRAAMTLQDEIDPSVSTVGVFADNDDGSGGGGGATGKGDLLPETGANDLDPLGLLGARKARSGSPAATESIADGTAAATKNAAQAPPPSKALGGRSGVGGPLEGGGGSSGGDAEIELDIDLKHLEAGGGRPDLMELFSSSGAATGDVGSGARAGSGAVEEDSDEDFDGFVDDDDDDADEEERDRASSQVSAQGATASYTNEAALQRSVDMASRMAGWAGRVVERVLKEHRKPPGSAAGSSSLHRAARTTSASVPGTGPRNGESSTIRTGPAASGVGSHAAAQSASDERRRLEITGGNAGATTTSIDIGRQTSGSASTAAPTTATTSSSNDNGRQASGDAARPPSPGAGRGRQQRGAAVDAPADPKGTAHPHSESRSRPEIGGELTAPADTAAVTAPAVARGSEGKNDEGRGAVGTGNMAEDGYRDVESVFSESDGERGPPGPLGQRTPAGVSREAAGARGTATGEGFPPRTEAEEPEGAEEASGEAVAAPGPGATSASSSASPPDPAEGVTASKEKGGESARVGVLPQAIPPRAAAAESLGQGQRGGHDATEVDENACAKGEPVAEGPTSATRKYSPPRGNDGDEVGGGGTDSLFAPSVRGDTRPGPSRVGTAAGGGGIEANGDGEGVMGTSYLEGMDEDELEEESEKLKREGNKAQRDAETVTEEMKEEVMDLLKLFGVPYVVAPMEAEAQCCVLEQLRLVDGTVTDDSDAFAFGGRAVYKNIFSDRKFVEAYLLPDAEKDLGVGTDEVVALALLLGSDYTEGVRGVGIVNAMEVINAFPLEGKGAHHGLSKFKKWIDGFDPLLDQELEGLTKRGSQKEIDGLSLEMKFHLKHRTARNRWTVPDGFPSEEVINAYNNPQVDRSEEPFSWAAPDVDGLMALCQRVLGWDRDQSDGLLMPMVKELDRGSFAQSRIDRYFMAYHDNKRVAAIKSKRLRTAVEDLAQGSSEVITVDGSAVGKVNAKSAKKKRKRGDKSQKEQENNDSDDAPSGKTKRRQRGAAGTSPESTVRDGDDEDEDEDDDDTQIDQPTVSSQPSPSPRTGTRGATARAKRSRPPPTPAKNTDASGGGNGGRRSARSNRNASAGSAATPANGGQGQSKRNTRATLSGGEVGTPAPPPGKRRNPRRVVASSGGAGAGGGSEPGSDVEGEDGIDEEDDADYVGSDSDNDSSSGSGDGNGDDGSVGRMSGESQTKPRRQNK